MKEYKITGYVKIGFSKIVECESREKAVEIAEEIAYTEDVDFSDLNDWFDDVEVDEVEENEE